MLERARLFASLCLGEALQACVYVLQSPHESHPPLPSSLLLSPRIIASFLIPQVSFETPQLEPILKETYGVLLYQEQIMRMARDLAGYSLGQADLLRRAMGKKKRDEMERQRGKFMEGAVERGVSAEVAESLFDQMVRRWLLRHLKR